MDLKLKDLRILIAGVGSIGSELARQLAPNNSLYLLDYDETRCFSLIEQLKQEGYKVKGQIGNICNYNTIEDILIRFKPEVVFNCAARKHVSPMENTPMEAVRVNIDGTSNLLQCAGLWSPSCAKYINCSTDKVVNAENIMGATKKVAELMVKNAGGISVRFGNVLGSQGSVLEIWQRQIEKNQPLTVTDKAMTRYMMTIPEAVSLMIEAAEIGKPGEILIFDMGEPVNIYNLALEILKKAGKENLGVKLIGIRPGEALNEKLMTDDEKARAIKRGKFYVLPAGL